MNDCFDNQSSVATDGQAEAYFVVEKDLTDAAARRDSPQSPCWVAVATEALAIDSPIDNHHKPRMFRIFILVWCLRSLWLLWLVLLSLCCPEQQRVKSMHRVGTFLLR
jgi:hypothetical protein